MNVYNKIFPTKRIVKIFPRKNYNFLIIYINVNLDYLN